MISFSLALAIAAMAFFDRKKSSEATSHLDATAFLVTGLIDVWIIYIIANSKKMIWDAFGGG